jgi:uncharacterized RDD family membrane protein YckC
MEPPNVRYAGFWKRFVAAIIDSMILGVVELIVFIPFLGALGLGIVAHHDEEAGLAFIFALISAYLFAAMAALIAGWLYYALMESSTKQATLGKMAISIKVTDMAGNRISFGRATGRYFGKYVSALIMYIGFFMAGFTQQKQALHDIMASCLVVNK